jgi:hypothetical protein
VRVSGPGLRLLCMNTLACTTCIAILGPMLAVQPARADISTNSFGETVIMGTLTVETPGGSVLATFNDLYVNETFPSDLTARIAADTTVPTFIRNNIGLFADEGTFDYLAAASGGTSFPSELLSVNGSVGTVSGDGNAIVTNDLESNSLGVVTATGSVLVDESVYVGLIGLNPDPNGTPTAYQGDVIFFFYNDSVVETVATPEPGGAVLAALGVLLAIGFIGRNCIQPAALP